MLYPCDVFLERTFEGMHFRILSQQWSGVITNKEINIFTPVINKNKFHAAISKEGLMSSSWSKAALQLLNVHQPLIWANCVGVE